MRSLAFRASFRIGANCLIAAAAFSAPLNTGNKKIETPGLQGAATDTSAPAFAPADLHDEIASVYGDDLANEIVGELGADGSVGFGELFGENDSGVSDVDTILINSKDSSGTTMTETEAAMVVVHEYQHVQNRRAGSCGAPPCHQDPITSDPLCGPCSHASMHYDQANAVLNMVCAQTSGSSDLIDWCKFVETSILTGDQHAYGDKSCSASACPAGHADMVASRTHAQQRLNECCTQ